MGEQPLTGLDAGKCIVCKGQMCRAEGLGQELLHTGIRTASGKLSSDMENVFQDFMKQEL